MSSGFNWSDLLVAGIGVAGDTSSTIGSGMFSAKQAERNRKFQEKMYRHRYQYAVEDMRAAGLNPILAATKGLGGGTPGGATAAQVSRGDAFSRAAGTAIAARRQRQELKNLEADEAMKWADSGLKTEQMNQTKQMQYLTNSQLGESAARIELTKAQTRREIALGNIAQFDVYSAKRAADWAETPAGRAFYNVGQAVKAVSPLIPQTRIGPRYGPKGNRANRSSYRRRR